MKPLGSVASVLAALREDAKAELDRNEKAAEEELARLAADEQAPPELTDREARLGAAHKEARERLAREDWADSRAAIESRERWIASAVAEGARLLSEPLPRAEQRALLLQLAREGLSRLPGDRFEVLVPPRDAPLCDAGFCAELGPGVSASGSDQVRSGCIVRTSDGRASFDNTFGERARRFESRWRAALGKVYQT